MEHIHTCGNCEEQEQHILSLMENENRDAILSDAAALLKIFGEPTRVRIMFVLLEHELCVCDIAEQLGMTSSAISHQLSILRQARLVKSRRSGKTIYYSLADDHVKTILFHAVEHIME